MSERVEFEKLNTRNVFTISQAATQTSWFTSPLPLCLPRTHKPSFHPNVARILSEFQEN